MARIVVTGGAGMLGSTLVPSLRDLGHEVVVLGRGPGAALQADLADPAAVHAALGKALPDAVINLAAATNVDACEKDPAAAFSSNALAVRNIADWMLESPRGAHLVQVSTDQVYSGDGPHREDGERPINYYAYSKLAGEQYAARAAATVLRTNLFGRSRCAGRVSLSDWLVQQLRSGANTNVFSDVYFSPLSMETLSAMIARVVDRRHAGTFNLGSHGGMSKGDFAFSLADTLGYSTRGLVRSRCADVPLAARRPLDMRMDSTKFETAFEVRLPSLESEISSMRNYYGSPN